jgi:Signal transduction histidine kinase
MLNVSGILDGHSGNLDEELQEDITDISESLDRLSNLTIQLLDTSKLEFVQGMPAGMPVCLNDLVREAIGSVCGMCKRFNHTITTRLCDLPTITADRPSLVSAITNLLTNAIKYTPQGGSILILTDINFSDNVVKLIVADNGRGVPNWAQDKIFERFFRWGDNKTIREDSNGLGLYIVKTVINDHGGNVFVRSPLPAGRFEELELGGERLGSMFIIKLPIK